MRLARAVGFVRFRTSPSQSTVFGTLIRFCVSGFASEFYRRHEMRYGRFATVLTLRLVTTAMLVTGLFAIPAVAQTVVNGDVIGTVTDSAGAVVEGTNVTLVDTA